MYAIVNHKVKDYEVWKPFYDADAGRRASHGVVSDRVFRDSKDPNNVFLIFEISDLEAFNKMPKDSEFQKVLAQAGVIGIPVVSIVEQV